jgi:hypothetical protein
MRKFLLYEIPGLFTLLYLLIFYGCFEDPTYFTELIKSDWQGLATIIAVIAIIAIPTGWLEYQFYDSVHHVHYGTISFKFIQSTIPGIRDECCHAILDYILKDCYKKYPGLGDSFGGFWEHYKARNVVGIFAPIPFFLAVIFKFIFMQFPFHWNICILFLIILAFNLVIVWDAKRIRKEVENREYLYVCIRRSKFDPSRRSDFDPLF